MEAKMFKKIVRNVDQQKQLNSAKEMTNNDIIAKFAKFNLNQRDYLLLVKQE